MKKAKKLMRTLGTRSVIAALPVAMVSAYAVNFLVPTEPRMAAYEFQQVAEITVSPTTVGIATSPLYGQTQAQIEAQLDEMQALGVENIRVFVPWALIEYAPVDAANPTNNYYWDALDVVMAAAEERNMGVLAEVNFTPTWAAANGEPTYNGLATADPDEFAAFMGDFVDRYGSVVSAYEIWNEPNAVLFSNPIDPAGYAALLKAAYPVIKAADPTATVVAGALGHVINFGNWTMDPVDFLNGMIAAGVAGGYDVQDYFDALSYHPYDESLAFTAGDLDPAIYGQWVADTAYNQLKQLMEILDPDKKVWLTEFGVPTYSYTDGNGVVHTVTQQQQEDLIKNLVENWGSASFWNDPVILAKLGPIFLYTGRDTATGSTDPNANYGLWDSLGIPKEVITDFLAQWYIANPQNPTDPTDPPDPVDPLAAALQALANQIAQAFADAIAQAFAQTIGQQIVDAIVQAIANALAGLGQPPATTAEPMSLRIASEESSEETTSLAAEPESLSVTDVSAKSGVPEAVAVEAEAAAVEAEPAAAEASVAAEATAAEATEAAPATAQEPATVEAEPATAAETPSAPAEPSTNTAPSTPSSESSPSGDTKTGDAEKKPEKADKKLGDPDKKSRHAEKKAHEAKSGVSEAKPKVTAGAKASAEGAGSEGAGSEGGGEG